MLAWQGLFSREAGCVFILTNFNEGSAFCFFSLFFLFPPEGRRPSLLPALTSGSPQAGPCLFKLWELIPREAAQTVIDLLDSEVGEYPPGTELLPLCLRVIGSTIYQYRPTGEPADGLVPGIFATLPITGFALIRYHDGSVNDRAKEKIYAGLEAHGSHALPFYETDR